MLSGISCCTAIAETENRLWNHGGECVALTLEMAFGLFNNISTAQLHDLVAAAPTLHAQPAPDKELV